jgi:hypothetical protein
VKVYVAGLYLEHKSTDADGIIKADAPKKIVMKFLHDASKKQMTDAFDQSFKDNAPDAETTIKTDTDKFLASLEPVKVGEQMVFTYVPGTGTTFAINGKDKLTIAGPAFRPGHLLRVARPQAAHVQFEKGHARAIGQAGRIHRLNFIAELTTG